MQKLKMSIRNVTVVSAILIALICMLASNIVLYIADNEMTKVRETAIDNIISEQQFILNNELDNAKINLQSLSVGMSHLDSEDYLDYLHTQNSIMDFFSVYFFNNSGEVLSPVVREFSFDGIIDYANNIQNNVIISTTYVDRVSGDTLINMQVPVIKNGSVTGYLFAEYSLAPLLEHLREEVSESGYAVLTDNKAVDFFSTYANFTPLHLLKDELSDSGYELSTIQSNIENKISGTAYFELDGISRIASYVPIDSTDWTLAIIMEEHLIEKDLSFILNGIIICFIILIFFALAATVQSWRVKKQIELAAYYDELTALPNIDLFKQHIEQVLKKNTDKDFIAIKFDINNFKAINEMFGFEVGNKVLLAFAKTSQIADEKTLFLARAGNDEFIMFAGNGFLEEFEKLTSYYEEYFKQLIPELQGYHLTFSYGRYFIDRGETDANEVVTKTSLAHSIAKTDKSKVIWDFDKNYKMQILRHAEISSKMEKALKNNEFVPFLQPKWSLTDNKLVGAEALVRWFEKDGGMIYPDIFIPLFETNGFIIELDKYILKMVCKTLREWIENGIDVVPVSVNFSRAHFYKKSFTDDIKMIVDSYNLPHNLIEVELTETTILDNTELFEEILANLSAENFKISIDDFGAGYSSLGMLKNLKVNTLKLDRSFLINNENVDNQRGDKVIDGIIKLAHSIGMTIVAEGVEEKSQVEFLKKLGCEMAQGYYYAKPISCDDFKDKFFKS